MSLTIEALAPGALELNFVGKLDESDYDAFARETESRLEQMEKVSLLIHVEAFQGWTTRGLFEDIKYDVKHFNDVSRVAVVANDEHKEWMAKVSKPFTSAEVRFFNERTIEDARAWVTATPQ